MSLVSQRRVIALINDHGVTQGDGKLLGFDVKCPSPNSDSTYIVVVSVVTRSVICEVEELVAMVVTKLLVIVVEITGSDMEADAVSLL